MRDRYLLDTSALRALPFSGLAAATRHTSVFVSPFCVWELFSHLEDAGDFERVKAHLMKLRHVTVLDDPNTTIERLVVRSSDEVHQRVSDTDIIYATLAALRDSPTIESFYEKHIEDPDGQVRRIAQCGERAKMVLENEEQRFAEFVGKVMAAVVGGVSLASPEDRHRATLDLLNGWWLQLASRIEHTNSLHEKFARLMYVYCSYVVNRSAEYISRKAKVDVNDFEDVRFCLHLDMDLPFVAVTTDRGLRRGLEATVMVLNSLHDESCRTLLAVLDVTDFRSRFGDAV